MTLRLTIQNFGRLDNGSPSELLLQQRGAMIGRSPACDWSLPDPRNHISSRHCEIRYQNGAYVLTDISMNGTYVNGGPDRLARPHRIADGDVLTIGQYEVRAALMQDAQPAGAAPAAPAASGSHWGDWGSPPAPPPSAPPASGGWGSPAAAPASSGGWGNVPIAGGAANNDSWAAGSGSSGGNGGSDGWAPAPAAAATPPAASAWDVPTAPAQNASGWSSAAPDRPAPPSPDDIWGQLAEGNVVDWARGGFGQPITDNPDPLGVRPQSTPEALGVAPPRPFGTPDPAHHGAPTPVGAPVSDIHFAMPPTVGATPAPPAQPAPPAPRPIPDTALIEAFLRAAGVDRAVAAPTPALLDRAGQLFHRLVAGLVVMVEARARAKSQMGAESTAFEVDGNNPIKFARTPEDAIAALLNPPARGFMDAGQAVEQAYMDLQSHQMATLRAMQGALRATLDRFSPTAIRQRAESGGMLGKILPAARDAALWQAYEKEFGGVAQGSDEAFMDVFAKEFRRAYDEQSRVQRRRS